MHFLCVVMILSSTMLFSGCNAAEEITEQTTAAETLSDEELDALVENMPDTVFVKFYWDYRCVTAGEYIDKNGYIRNFEFREGDWLEYDYRIDPIYNVKRLYQYTEVRNIKIANDMIIQHYKESGDNDGINEIVFIQEYETAYLTTKEKNANNLFVDLGNVFSKKNVVPSYGW